MTSWIPEHRQEVGLTALRGSQWRPGFPPLLVECVDWAAEEATIRCWFNWPWSQKHFEFKITLGTKLCCQVLAGWVKNAYSSSIDNIFCFGLHPSCFQHCATPAPLSYWIVWPKVSPGSPGFPTQNGIWSHCNQLLNKRFTTSNLFSIHIICRINMPSAFTCLCGLNRLQWQNILTKAAGICHWWDSTLGVRKEEAWRRPRSFHSHSSGPATPVVEHYGCMCFPVPVLMVYIYI